MQFHDLDLRHLLEFDPEQGLLRFAGQRALILDTTALGILRKQLVDQFGLNAARTVITRFGYAQGWRMAEALKSEFKWEAEEDWLRAGERLPMFNGMYQITKGDSLSSVKGMTIAGSYEADQHIAFLGKSDSPTCWGIGGFLSGYLSFCSKKNMYVLEEHCVGKGDADCHLFGRAAEEWGGGREELDFYQSGNLKASLDANLHRTTEALKKAEEKIRERQRLLEHIARREVEEPQGTVARSPAMRRLIDMTKQVAKVDSTVLITGESGTGKEHIARMIHHFSPRSTGPFIAVNCGAITETLLESELFGHARGSFTDAAQDRAGLMEAANNGTLFLDEVSEISPGMQVKLLRVLQEREIRRVGENKNRKIDIRVIASTNRDLAHEIARGTFRHDLYYRLKVVGLRAPPLRERRDDILPLARVLLEDAAQRLKRPVTVLAPEAADPLLRYTWPGNVRELGNVMERAIALARIGRTELEDLPEEVRMALPGPTPLGVVRPMVEIEREYILAALEINKGNQALTAVQLGIGTATLYRKLKGYGVTAGKGEN